jgi:hypothetical protein
MLMGEKMKNGKKNWMVKKGKRKFVGIMGKKSR